MNSNNDRRALPIYLLFTFALSSVFYFLIIKSGSLGGAGGGYATGLMWCPALAALLACRYIGRDAGSLGWEWGKTRYQVLSYLIPLGYCTVTYALIWLTGLGGLKHDEKFAAGFTQFFGLGPMPLWASVGLYFLFLATTGVIRGCATALGEEIGWRGFLVPELAKRTSFTATAVISGFIWALWHYPIIIFADYNAGTPLWYGLAVMTVGVIFLSVIMVWLRLKSGSLWTGVLLHASHNVFIQQFFGGITADTGWTRYVAGEFGVGALAAVILVASYFWTRRDEVSAREVRDLTQPGATPVRA